MLIHAANLLNHTFKNNLNKKRNMSNYICSVCGYTHEGNEVPGRCPVCKSPSSQFTLQDEVDKDDVQNLEHVVNVKKTLGNGEILQGKGNSQESNEDTAEDAINIVSSLKDGCCSEDDANEILKFGNDKIQAVQWYKEKYNCGLKEAKDVVDSVLDMPNVSSVADNENDDTYPLNNDGNDRNKGKSGKNSCLIVIGVIVLLFIIGLLVNNEESEQNKESNLADSISCVDSVEVELDIKSSEYVKKYLEETLNQAKDESIERALTKYFSKDFVSFYKEVDEIDNRNPGEIGFWNSDFWTGWQDGEIQCIKVIRVKDITTISAIAIVQLTIKMGDYDESKISKEVKLQFEGGKWEIDDYDNYKRQFKNYIATSVEQLNEVSETIFADSVAVAE